MIPKNIFQTWHTTELHHVIQNKIDGMKKLNPDYTHKIYIDEEIDTFVNEQFPGDIAQCYNKLNIIVAKTDLWRYLILYKYGGVYVDMDSSINCDLNTLIQSTDNAVITAERNPNTFVQWALVYDKDHPILQKTIELIVDNIKKNSYPNDLISMTGPRVYSKAINAIHNAGYNESINHYSINEKTDITYQYRNTSYRLYGIDYNNLLSFKYPESDLLYINKNSWREELRFTPLLKKENNI